ncbi:PREDICTED: uncharacterized protein LOC109191599 [Ipomoea nil]|uniref:uncharacterized protein LOC109191599 n=1 Tax=Ipomoea nil TaxID=35883 RepID=UPI000901FB51|nr:PREDICTED: uncharacterized protein LOC109191599 [Ipomoea nil]
MAERQAENVVATITARWADLALEEEEVAPFAPQLDESEGAAAGKAERWMLLGRFLTNKLVKVEYMRQVMAAAWQPVTGMQVSEIKPRLFMFTFHHVTDIQRVLNDGPWPFENATLICEQLVEGGFLDDVVLDTVQMWIQVHGLPMGYTSDKILEQIGNYLGTFVKGDDRVAGAPWKVFYRIRLAIPVEKPMKRRLNFVKRDKSTCWVTFKYERLHNFCFYYGKLGHLYKFCRMARDSVLPVEEYPYSTELRAGIKRGPRAVGEHWLLPTQEQQPRTSEAAAGQSGVAELALPNSSREEADYVMKAVAKRRKEGYAEEEGRRVGNNGDVTMTDLSKNLFMAGAGSQPHPSS